MVLAQNENLKSTERIYFSNAEEGEILEDPNDEGLYEEQRVTNIKRRRDSSPDESDSYYRRGPRGQEGRRDWDHEREYFRDRYGDRDGTEYDDFAPRGQRHPRAHSTAGPNEWRNQNQNQPARVTRPTSVARPMTNTMMEASRLGSVKMFKVESFPKNVKPTDQYQEWNYWISNFEMAVEKAGTTDQRAKAIDLSLHIGEELRRIIVAKAMLPRESAVPEGFPFYDNLVKELEGHFKGLTDETVDVTSFNKLKQEENETALQFEMRLMMLAKRVNETNKAMIRTRFIEGLRDQAIKERAFIDGISLKDVVKMATRKEAITAKQQMEFSPWNEDGRGTAVVAAMSRSQHPQPGRSSRGYGGSSHNASASRQEYSGGRHASNRTSGQDTRGQASRCKRCGVVQHKGNSCPAEKASCFKCKEIGHFRHMCAAVVRAVEPDERNEKGEVQNDFYE